MTQSFDTRRPAALGAKRGTGFGPGIGAGRGGRSARAGGAILACFLVSACTALPEWADPGGWFDEETPPPSRISAAQDLEQAQSGDFPNLASVPDAPRAATPPAKRQAIAAGLAADRANARYSGERLMASGAEPAAEAPASAPAAPAIAQSLGATAAPAEAAPAAIPSAGLSAGRTSIAPPPRPALTPAQSPAQSPATGDDRGGGAAPAMAPAAVVVPGTAVVQSQTQNQAQAQAQGQNRVLPIPRRSELAGIIYFAHGSHTLDANDQQVLRDILALSRERGATIRVVGHASARTSTVDPVEHQVANLEISQKRADSVAAALIRLGAARDRVRVEAQSDSLPVYHEFMPTGEAGNRRTEIFLEY